MTCRCHIKNMIVKGVCLICRQPAKKTEAPAGHPVDCQCDKYYECVQPA
jgi:hypothetical protein